MKFEPKAGKGKLDKMSMPSKKKPLDSVAVMELELDPGPDADMADDGPGGQGPSEEDMANELDGEGDGETDGPLADASDDDLLAEVRKRGLSASAEKADSDEPLSDDEY